MFYLLFIIIIIMIQHIVIVTTLGVMMSCPLQFSLLFFCFCFFFFFFFFCVLMTPVQQGAQPIKAGFRPGGGMRGEKEGGGGVKWVGSRCPVRTVGADHG